jgi:hypothetical protein
MAESYGKNYFTPRNILLYLIIGGVVYALVYFLFMKNGNSYTSPDYMQPATTQVQTAPASVSMTVQLASLNSSGETGTAILSDENGKTKVVVAMQNEPASASQPAHIHVGACPAPGAVKYPLSNVVGGTSETVLDVDMATLKSELPLAVNVHKSNNEITSYVSCGDLK